MWVKRSYWRRRVWTGASASVLLLLQCNQPTPPPPPQGAIQGSLAATGGTPIAGVTIELLSAARVSLRAAQTSATGDFSFPGLDAGGYYVRPHISRGFTLSPAADSLRAVAVPQGAAATVRLLVDAIVQITDTVAAGATDTVVLGSGAALIVTTPPTASSLVVAFHDTTATTLPQNRPLLGPSVRLTLSPVPGTPQTNDSVVRISLSIPVLNMTLAAGTRWVFYLSAFRPTGEPLAEGLANATLGKSVVAAAPVKAATAPPLYLTLSVNPPTNAGSTITISPTTSTWNCPEEAKLYADPQDADSLGSRKVLLFVHGIQLDELDCADAARFDPASETFDKLLPIIRADADIKAHYKIYFFKYPTFVAISQNGAALAQQLEAPRPEASQGLVQYPNGVIVIAHSVGGLVSRAAMSNSRVRDAVERLVTLATPHLGTPNADPSIAIFQASVEACYNKNANVDYAWWLWVPLALGHLNWGSPGAIGLWSGSPFIADLPLYPTKVVPLAGGTTSGQIHHSLSFLHPKTSGMVHLACILEKVNNETRHDGAVPLWSARPAAVANNPLGATFEGLDHVDMTGDALTTPSVLFAKVDDLLHRGFPSSQAYVAGNGQSAPTSTPLPQPLVVQVMDGYGNGVRGVTVTFTVAQGGGSFGGLSQLSVQTDPQGYAQAIWTLGPTLGGNVATNTAPSLPGSTVTFAATATPGSGRGLSGRYTGPFQIGGYGFAYSGQMTLELVQSGTSVTGTWVTSTSSPLTGNTGSLSGSVGGANGDELHIASFVLPVLTSNGTFCESSLNGWFSLSVAGSALSFGQASGNDCSSSMPVGVGFWVTRNPPTVPTLMVIPSSSRLVTLGSPGQFIAVLWDANGTVIGFSDGSSTPGATFTWTSSDPTVAEVNQVGTVIARGYGTTLIIATANGVSGTATLTVAALP